MHPLAMMFSVVFMFSRFVFEGADLLSSTFAGRAGPLRTKRTRLRLRRRAAEHAATE